MDLTYRIIRFRPKHSPGLVQYIGMAWNYDLPTFFSTYTTTSYEGARAELANLTRKSYMLRWFDGEYEYDYASGQLFAAPCSNEAEAPYISMEHNTCTCGGGK